MPLPTVFSVGSGPGSAPIVFTYNQDGTVRSQATVFDPNFTGGVRTTTADFTGNGVADTVVGTGPGIATQVKILDGVSGNELFVFNPFEAAFTGGIYVTTGDLNGDGVPDLIITPDEGGGPRVMVISGSSFEVIFDFFGIDDEAFRGGARAAVGDVNGDGFMDLVVSAGFGGGPRIAIYSGAALQQGNVEKLVNDFFAFEPELRNGAFVAVGDVTGNGFGDLIFGGGPGGGPRVRVADAQMLLTSPGFGSLDEILDVQLANFFAGDDSNRNGVQVVMKNLNNDNLADLVTTSGGVVRAYAGSSLRPGVTPQLLDTLDPFPELSGVFVG